MESAVMRTNHTTTWQDWPDAVAFDVVGKRSFTGATSEFADPVVPGRAERTPWALMGLGMALLVGSGGSTGHLLDAMPSATTNTPETRARRLEILHGSKPKPPRQKGADQILSGLDLVAEVKATLGVNVTDLAMLARVSRQSIYDWLGGGPISQANYDRLFELRQICMDWQALAGKPVGRLLNSRNSDGISLLGLLEQTPLDRAAIRAQLEGLAAKAGEQESQRQQRFAKLAPLSDKDQRENALTHVTPATDA
jgi:hypothetical protein